MVHLVWNTPETQPIISYLFLQIQMLSEAISLKGNLQMAYTTTP